MGELSRGRIGSHFRVGLPHAVSQTMRFHFLPLALALGLSALTPAMLAQDSPPGAIGGGSLPTQPLTTPFSGAFFRPTSEYRFTPRWSFTPSQFTAAPPSSDSLFSHGKRVGSSPRLQFRLPFNTRQHTYLFGPQFRVFTLNRFTLNVFAQAGMAKRFAILEPMAAPTDAAPPLLRDPTIPPNEARFTGLNGLAAIFGGSLDFRITDHITYQAVKTEMLILQEKSGPMRDRRIYTGLRFSFGKL